MWWDHDCCIAGLLHMLDHHPDKDRARGDARRGALDPIRVLGHRLQPWIGRLDALPAHLTGRHGDYLTEQARHLERRIIAAERCSTR